MKLTTALLLFACLQVSAKGWSQDRITLKMSDTELRKVLFAIEKKSNYRFLFSEEAIKGKPRVNVDVVEAPVTEVLDKILGEAGIGYKIMTNNLVVLKEASGTIAVEIQEARITGKVTSATGEALAGVSVSVKGSRAGTTTDGNGNFSITVPDGATLVFSSVGYDTKEEVVGSRTTLDVSLSMSTRTIDQVVVVGYGSARRRDLTGSVSTIKGSDIASQPVQTATQAIQGKVAGVQIITSGAPNALPTVRVRGTGTMLGGADPLYVVDGVITEDIRNINSADILTMDILKDASATAIYGMRAANGVLLITTKKGRSGKMTINYDATVGIREAANLVNMAGPQQYAGYLNEASVYYDTGDSLINAAKLAGGYHTDWFDVILRRGMMQNHNVSLSGGSDKITYFFSAGYMNEQGIIEKNKFNRFTLRSNNEYRITSKLKLNTLVSYSRADLNDVDNGVLNNAYKAAPYVPSKLGGLYGNTSAAGNIANPILQLDKKFNEGIGNRVQGTFSLDYKPITWLTLRSSMGIDLDFFKNTQYSYRFLSDANTFIDPGGNQQQGNSVLSITSNDATKWVWDNTATFDKTYDRHKINFLVGMTAEQYKFNSLAGTRRDVAENKDQWYLNAGTTTGATNNGSGDKWARNSFLGRLSYAYDNRFLVTATMRADGTSRFGLDNRWGYFPSVGLGWNLSSESFMKDQTIFDNLKVRASFGRVGNDRIPTSLYYSLATINVPYYFNGSEFLGISFNSLNDRNVQWEVTDELDLGVDFTILDNRLSGELDYYNKKTKDALIFVNIPAILGDADNRYITNAASFENKGVEVSLNWADKIGSEWKYNIGGNVAFNKNQIVGLNGGQALFDGSISGQSNVTKSDNGQPIGSFYTWTVTGILQNDAEVASSGQSGAKVGDFKYLDVDKNGTINELDREYQGSYIPKVTYGVNGGASFKSFDLTFNTYGTAGSKIYNGKKATRGAFAATDNVETDVVKNRWTPDNPSNTEPRANLKQWPASSYFIENGDFFRLNNLTIGYTLPSASLTRYKLSALRVYVTAQNLFTITGYSGFTPELQSSSPLNGGIELNSYPTTRTFAIGLSIGL